MKIRTLKKLRVLAAAAFAVCTIGIVTTAITIQVNAEDAPHDEHRTAAADAIATAAECRTGIILDAVAGKLKPAEDRGVNGRKNWTSVWKTAAYFCQNVTEASRAKDVLEELFDHSSMNDRWPATAGSGNPTWRMSPQDKGVRTALIKLIAEPSIVNVMVKGVVAATEAQTPEKTKKNRSTLLGLLDTARAYLETYDEKAEDAWQAECQQEIAAAVSQDKDTKTGESYFSVQYRFNQFAPGKFKEGGLPSPDRFIHTFIYRRLKSDGMTKEQIRSGLNIITAALAPPAPRKK